MGLDNWLRIIWIYQSTWGSLDIKPEQNLGSALHEQVSVLPTSFLKINVPESIRSLFEDMGIHIGSQCLSKWMQSLTLSTKFKETSLLL